MELKKFWSVIQKNRLLFLLGAAGLILLLFTGAPQKETENASPFAACEEYRAALSSDLSEACAKIKGVGDVHLTLTLATTEIAVYEKNASGESETVALSGGDALLLAYRMPEVAGVSVACTGGGDAGVRRELTSLLCTLLDLDTTSVHIAPLK